VLLTEFKAVIAMRQWFDRVLDRGPTYMCIMHMYFNHAKRELGAHFATVIVNEESDGYNKRE
jgi:hypothetical protein